MNFKLVSSFKPTGDQPQAIEKLSRGIRNKVKDQVLLGVTGSGKTFTLANVIQNVQRPTLIISHNKTLAAQLYQEFRDFFPQNAVSFFVSYYDYYQPEAYIPRTDTYIEKETDINEEIDKLRLLATTNLLTRKDTIIIASVSCIYNIGSPKEYGNFVLKLHKNQKIKRESIISRFIDLQYTRSDFEFKRGTFRIRGENIDIFPAYMDQAIRINHETGVVRSTSFLDPINGHNKEMFDSCVIYPAKHYMTNPAKHKEVFSMIRDDLDIRVRDLRKQGHELEAHRLNQKVNYDLEMIEELGYVNGIENYSRYFDGRKKGDPPYTLLDYFKEASGSVKIQNKQWLLIIDESHMTIPQIRGMYNGDRSRKQTLIDFGFRLPAALDNRPLNFLEFTHRMPQTIYVSATPDEWEIERAQKNGIVEQLVRPTGILDPKILIRPTENQIYDLTKEIFNRIKNKQRVLVTTLTKRIAEELTKYMNEKKYMDLPEYKDFSPIAHPAVCYLHSDIQTLERSDILDDLRTGKYDVLVGINLLREGLDLPEVSMVAILDADKEGFLRSETSLIQTMGRAARHIEGTVIMYADEITSSMKRAISEIDRRRKIQSEYNRVYNIKPQNIIKPIREKLVDQALRADMSTDDFLDEKKRFVYRSILSASTDELTPQDRTKLVGKMEREMKLAAGNLNFELATEIRDKIREIKKIS